MASKKDYEMCASVLGAALLRDEVDAHTVGVISEMFAYQFKRDNPNFQLGMFLNKIVINGGLIK